MTRKYSSQLTGDYALDLKIHEERKKVIEDRLKKMEARWGIIHEEIQTQVRDIATEQQWYKDWLSAVLDRQGVMLNNLDEDREMVH